MNIKEVVDCGRYTIFSRMGEDSRNKHIMIVNYIDQIASASSIDISDWNLFSIFGRGRGNHLITDKRDINRRFFAKFREIQNGLDPDRFSLEANVQARLNDQAREIMGRQLADFAHRKDHDLSQAKRLATQSEEKLSAAFALDQQIRVMSNRQIDIAAQVSTILAEGFWKYEELDGNKLILSTVGDVTCHQVNPNAGLDLHVNLGKYKAILDLSRMTLKATGLIDNHDDNIFSRHGLPWHPHIASNICWGRSKHTVMDLLASCELVEVFRIFANLLSDYCDDAPYCSLIAYQEVIDREERNSQLNTPVNAEALERANAEPDDEDYDDGE